MHLLDSLREIDVISCVDNLNGISSLNELTLFLINSNKLPQQDLPLLADKYLQKEELETYHKRLKILAKKEFIASRTLIKRIVAKVYNYLFDHLKVAFNHKQLCLQVFYKTTLLPLTLSLSHSKGLVALAIKQTTSTTVNESEYVAANECKRVSKNEKEDENKPLTIDPNSLGIDIENICDKRDWLKLAKYYFHANDISYLTQQKTQHKAQGFYQLWTLKEAYCKMIKEPIVNHLSLDTLSVLAKLNVSTCHYNQHRISIVCSYQCKQPNTILLVESITNKNITIEKL